MNAHIHTYIHIRGSKRNVLTLPAYDAHDVHAIAQACADTWHQRVQVYTHEGERIRNASALAGTNARKHLARIERKRAEVRPARIADKRARAEIRERKRAERAEARKQADERERKRQAAIARVQARMREAGAL